MPNQRRKNITIKQDHINLIGQLLFDPEEQQLRLLAKKLTSAKEPNLIYRRSIVLDIHLSLEYFMNNALAIYSVNNATARGRDSDVYKIRSKFEKFNYAKKITLIDVLKLAPNSIEILSAINKLRNDLVHRYLENDVAYFNNPITEQATINKLLEDREKIKKELADNLYGRVENINFETKER